MKSGVQDMQLFRDSSGTVNYKGGRCKAKKKQTLLPWLTVSLKHGAGALCYRPVGLILPYFFFLHKHAYGGKKLLPQTCVRTKRLQTHARPANAVASNALPNTLHEKQTPLHTHGGHTHGRHTHGTLTAHSRHTHGTLTAHSRGGVQHPHFSQSYNLHNSGRDFVRTL